MYRVPKIEIVVIHTGAIIQERPPIYSQHAIGIVGSRQSLAQAVGPRTDWARPGQIGTDPGMVLMVRGMVLMPRCTLLLAQVDDNKVDQRVHESAAMFVGLIYGQRRRAADNHAPQQCPTVVNHPAQVNSVIIILLL